MQIKVCRVLRKLILIMRGSLGCSSLVANIFCSAICPVISLDINSCPKPTILIRLWTGIINHMKPFLDLKGQIWTDIMVKRGLNNVIRKESFAICFAGRQFL
jgi:hypothetical protein